MKKSNNKLVAKVVVAVSVLSIVGVLSQQVEKELDKEEVKAYVQENFKEDDNNEEHINFENGNQNEDSFLEYIGF
ncbi:hypothetical protein [Breznakia pachnodae]|uniref:Uncharacterized protein n=1 Tax=Breznakia pachnodae TaxID=265178 RepID=A0ABU0E196_9FIRM|nr:hypothetical protein [Breznakia pachnodae]MDQ0360652.1 hypothetical protein [Breznakia pachnodae]